MAELLSTDARGAARRSEGGNLDGLDGARRSARDLDGHLDGVNAVLTKGVNAVLTTLSISGPS